MHRYSIHDALSFARTSTFNHDEASYNVDVLLPRVKFVPLWEENTKRKMSAPEAFVAASSSNFSLYGVELGLLINRLESDQSNLLHVQIRLMAREKLTRQVSVTFGLSSSERLTTAFHREGTRKISIAVDQMCLNQQGLSNIATVRA